MAQQRTLTVALRAAVQGYTRPVQRAAAATGTLEASIQRTQRTGMAMSRVGDSMTRGVTLPLVGLGVMAARAAGNFESSMNRVRAVSGATGDEFEAMSDLAREMGSTTAFSASEAADAMVFLSQAGFSASETMDALPATLNLAAASGLDLATSADIASNVLSGFGLEVDQLDRVVDVMALTMTSANVNVEMLGETFGYAGPVAAAAGLEFEEVAAAAGLMGNAGIQASRAGTALRGSISRLLNPTSEVSDTLERLGVSVTDSHGDLLPLVDIMGQLEQAGATTSDMMKIFGTEAGPAMQALLSQGSEELENLTGELENAGGTAETLAAIQMEGLNGAIKELSSAFEGFLIDIGDALIPVLQDVAGVMATIARGFSSLPGPVQKTAVMFGLVVAASGPLLSVGGRIVTTWGKMRAAYAAATTAMQRHNLTSRQAGIALGGATAAIGIAVLAWAEYNAIQQAQKQRANELRDALEETEGAVSGVTEELVTSRLRDGEGSFGDGYVSMLNDIGVSLDDVMASLDMSESEFQSWINAVGLAASVAGMSSEEVALLQGRLISLRTGVDEGRDSLDEFSEFTGDAADGASDVGAEVAGMADAADEAAAALDEMTSAMSDALDQSFSLDEAERNLVDTFQQAQEQFAENGATLDVNTQAGRDNQVAAEDLTQAHLDMITALIDEGATVEETEDAISSHRGELRRQLSQMGLNEDQVDRYVGALDNATGEYKSEVVLESSQALNDLEHWQWALNNVPGVVSTTLSVGLSGLGASALQGRATGGPVAAGRAYVVGEEGPELFVSETSGTVIPNHAITAGRPEQFATVGGMGMGGGGSTVVNLYATGRMGRAVMESIRAEVRERGRGNVQVALGQGAA